MGGAQKHKIQSLCLRACHVVGHRKHFLKVRARHTRQYDRKPVNGIGNKCHVRADKDILSGCVVKTVFMNAMGLELGLK